MCLNFIGIVAKKYGQNQNPFNYIILCAKNLHFKTGDTVKYFSILGRCTLTQTYVLKFWVYLRLVFNDEKGF